MKLSKVLSLVLAIAMLFSMPTFAAFTDVAADASYAEAVTVLSALEIINGYEDGTFKPEGKITRAEYAAIVCRILDLDDAAQANKVGGIFTDVAADHWASGYIATAFQAGVINGMGDGTFAPEAEVTYEQAVKMLVAALGYELKAQTMGGYPTGYMMIANQESITVGTTNTAGGASRATVARLTYNSLTVPLMEQYTWGSDEYIAPLEDESILWSKLNAVKAEVTIDNVPLDKEETDVTLTGADFDKVADANSYSLPGTVKINGVDLAGLQGLKATVILDKSDDTEVKLVCVVPKAGKNVEITVEPTMMAEVSTSDGYVEYYKTNDDDRTTKIKVPTAGLTVYTNLVKTGAITVGGNAGDVAYRFVDTDNNGTFETVFVDNEKVFVVGSVNTNSNKIFRSTDPNALCTFTGASLTLDPENENLAWTIKDAEGTALEIADIEAGDVVAVKESTDSGKTVYEITVSNETVEGTINETFTETAKVGGSTLNKFTIGDGEYMTLTNSVMTPGDEITAKVYGDKVIAYEVKEGVKNYGIVIATKVNTDFDTTYQLQVLTQKGEIVTLNLADKVNSVTPPAYTDVTLATAFPKGDLIAYALNKAGEIKAIDVQTGYVPASANVLKDTDKMAAGTVLGGDPVQYKASAEKLGSYYITDNTVIFATEVAKGLITKEKVAVATDSIFQEDVNYNYAVIYNTNKEALVVVLFEAAAQIDYDTYPIAITKLATVTVEGDTRTKLFGYVNGEETEIIIAEDADASATALLVGDIALFTTNAAGEMTKALRLAEKLAGGYKVIDNAITGAADDEDGDAAGKYVHLFTTEINVTEGDAAGADAAAGTAMGTGSAVTLKGFAAAGKAYKVQGNLLRLINADDYALTFDGTINRDYTNLVDEDRIKDYTVNANAVAYLYNAKTNKFTVTTLLDAETDWTTMDYQHGDQLDNDDLVYAYNYDGETKLVLIIDVNGDN